MSNIDNKSLQIIEDMRSGLNARGYDENTLIVDRKDPLYYEVHIDSSGLTEIENLHSTLWSRYLPDHESVFVGVTYSDIIPEEKIPFAIAFLNVMNSGVLSQHMTLCPVCHKIDTIAGISLTRKKLPKEKFQILLTISEANAYFLHPTIWQITDAKHSVDYLVSIFCEDYPEFKKYFGGKS